MPRQNQSAREQRQHGGVDSGPAGLAACPGDRLADRVAERRRAVAERRQARAVFENLKQVLAAAGLAFDDLIELVSYHTNMADLEAVVEVKAEFLTRTGSVAAEWVRTLSRLNLGQNEATHGVRAVRQRGDAAGRPHAAGGPALAL